MPRGWGRRATGKPDRKLEDDALFKEIGGQLEANNFDYSQWQRTAKSEAKSDKGKLHLPKQLSGDNFSSGNVTSELTSKQRSTFLCKHGGHKRIETIKTHVNKDVDEKEERLKTLQLRILARKKTLEEYKNRELQLLEENIKLQRDIENNEGESHQAVKKLLRKYEKFRGGITTLNDKFMRDHDAALNDLEETKERLYFDLLDSQRIVDETEKRLQLKQEELHVILCYKDKEYPVKALKISDLQSEVAQLKIGNEEEELDLTRIVENEINKQKKEQMKAKDDVTKKITEKSMKEMHPSLRDMAMQNLVMQKEIKFHTATIEELEKSNMCLQAEVKRLLKDPKTSIRQQMFPEFYPQRPKCTPDMDIVLDIPTQKWLPI